MLNQQAPSKELPRNILMTLTWVKNRGVIKMSFINFVLTPRAAVLLDFTGGRYWRRRRSGKRHFLPELVAQRRCFIKEGLMDPPGCLLSLHCAAATVPEAKLAAL